MPSTETLIEITEVPLAAATTCTGEITMLLLSGKHTFTARVLSRPQAVALADTVRVAVLDAPAYFAEMVTGVEVLTDFVLMANFVVVMPVANVTLAGTVATILLLERIMLAP